MLTIYYMYDIDRQTGHVIGATKFTREALVAARILEEFSDLAAVLHQDLNYDWYWAVNETGEILDKAIGYYDHSEEDDFTRASTT